MKAITSDQHTEVDPMVSFFGYPTYEAFRAAHIATATTAALRKEFDQTYEEHVEQVLRRVGGPDFFECLTTFVEYGWSQNPAMYRDRSLGWYFHHPETRKLVAPEFLTRYDAICGPMAPCYG